MALIHSHFLKQGHTIHDEHISNLLQIGAPAQSTLLFARASRLDVDAYTPTARRRLGCVSIWAIPTIDLSGNARICVRPPALTRLSSQCARLPPQVLRSAPVTPSQISLASLHDFAIPISQPRVESATGSSDTHGGSWLRSITFRLVESCSTS